MNYFTIMILLSMMTLLVSCDTIKKDEDVIKKIAGDVVNEVIEDSVKNIDP